MKASRRNFKFNNGELIKVYCPHNGKHLTCTIIKNNNLNNQIGIIVDNKKYLLGSSEFYCCLLNGEKFFFDANHLERVK